MRSLIVTDSVRSEEVGRSLAEGGLLVQCPVSPGQGRNAGGGFESQDGGIPPVTPLRSTTMATTSNHSVTSASGVSSDGGTSEGQDSTMTVLIVLVCVIGFIALVLGVILIIVCMRRRRPKIEHVYAVPSTCQALSHTYLGDDPPPEPVPRPRLVQAYSDVADARPPGQPPQVTPASPAYAEVEEIADVDADDKTRKRFNFRFRKRPSVSSTGGNSALYEDVNPVPVNNASVSKTNAAAPKNNTLPKYSGSKLNSSPVGPYSTGVVKKGGKRGGESPKIVRESPVYVHVVDSGDVNSATNPSNASTEKRPVAPLAAKFIANIDKSATNKVGGTRGKTEASTRLYPLQEGRVANLVSTLNRKKDTKNGVTAKEESGQVS